MSKKATIVMIDEEVREELEQRAAANDQSISEFLRSIIYTAEGFSESKTTRKHKYETEEDKKAAESKRRKEDAALVKQLKSNEAAVKAAKEALAQQ